MYGGQRYWVITNGEVDLMDIFGNTFRFENERDANDYLEENELAPDGWRVECLRW